MANQKDHVYEDHISEDHISGMQCNYLRHQSSHYYVISTVLLNPLNFHFVFTRATTSLEHLFPHLWSVYYLILSL